MSLPRMERWLHSITKLPVLLCMLVIITACEGEKTILTDSTIHATDTHATDTHAVDSPSLHTSNCTPHHPVSQENTNPLEKYQWHLSGSTEQTDFGMNTNVFKQPLGLNLSKTWRTYGCKGQGVVVAVVDNGLQIHHPDIAANIDARIGDDFADGIGGNLDPSPATDSDKPASHGTIVAGIIAMVDNQIGGLGVAPSVKLLGYNYVSYQSTVNEIASFAIADVVNQSYTFNAPAVFPSSSHENYAERIQNGRGGRGTIFVKAAGNGYLLGYSNNNNQPKNCTRAIAIGSSCEYSGEDDSNSQLILVVAAVNTKNIRSSYSTAGSNIWISGYGGEFGLAKTRYTLRAGDNSPDFTYSGYPAIITTDLMGCTYGNSRENYGENQDHTDIPSLNEFDYVWPTNSAHHANDKNPDCNYTSTANGTSAATPTISGVVALLLSQNPELTIFDIRHILAKTAKKIDRGYETATQYTIDKQLGSYTFNRGWVTNAAGYHYSDWYGFGLADVDAALAMARAYTNFISKEQLQSDALTSGILNSIVSNKNINGITDTINVIHTGTVKHLRIRLGLVTSALQDIEISLQSPSRTSYTVYTAGNGHENTPFTMNVAMAVNAFYDEPIQGNWMITVKDLFSKTDISTAENKVINNNFADTADDTFTEWNLELIYDPS